MLSIRNLVIVAAVVAASHLASTNVEAHPYMKPLYRAQTYNWNQPYAHVQYGQPVALVVPPTANLQTNWGWGVSSSRVSRMDHQFGRDYPGTGSMDSPYRNTPVWPQDTNQFGVYYIRGPW